MDKNNLEQMYLRDEMSMQDIGKAFGRSAATIHYWLRKHNIASRKSTHWTSSRRKKMSGENHPMFGKFHDEETRKKISKGVLLNNPFKGVTGSRHHAWKGGVDSINRAIRDTHQLNLWRTNIFERDDYTCKFCNQKGGELNVDHIVPLAEIIKQYNLQTIEEAYDCKVLWDINNGRTLCVPCHKTTKSWGRQPK